MNSGALGLILIFPLLERAISPFAPAVVNLVSYALLRNSQINLHMKRVPTAENHSSKVHYSFEMFATKCFASRHYLSTTESSFILRQSAITPSH